MVDRIARKLFVGDGHWLVADRQLAGRGRLGRAWGDGHGNFMGSVAFHLRSDDPMPATLALVAGVALADAAKVFAADLPIQLKWPNDLLIEGAKCAGILLERSGDYIVIGVGVNLLSAPDLPDRKTCCFADYGVDLKRNDFARALAIAMNDAVGLWRIEGVQAIISRWLPLAHPIGTPLKVSEQGLEGLFAGLTPTGALRLKNGQEILEIHAGDVEYQAGVNEGNEPCC